LFWEDFKDVLGRPFDEGYIIFNHGQVVLEDLLIRGLLTEQQYSLLVVLTKASYQEIHENIYSLIIGFISSNINKIGSMHSDRFKDYLREVHPFDLSLMEFWIELSKK